MSALSLRAMREEEKGDWRVGEVGIGEEEEGE